MPTSTPDQSLEQKVMTLEEALDSIRLRLARTEGRILRIEGARPRPGPRPDDLVVLTPRGARAPVTLASRRAADPATAKVPLERAVLEAEPVGDLVGGRWLAWIGGIATLLGIVLFLALAISHGWIGETGRVVMAALTAAGLVTTGVWAHGRRGAAHVSVILVGTGTAGMFATLIVATSVYDLVSPGVGIAGAIATGSAATVLAIRWAGREIAAIGLVGALASPVIVGAPIDSTAILVLLLTTVCALAVVVWRRWTWLAIATLLVGAPQWAWWLRGWPPVGSQIAVMAAFAALGLIAALGTQLRCKTDALQPAAAALLALNATIAALIGYFSLRHSGHDLTAELWLVALGAAHAVPALLRSRRLERSRRMRELLLAVAFVLADVAFGLMTGGLVLTFGWGAIAVGFGWLTRRYGRDDVDEALLALGLGAHVGLVLLRTYLAAPPSLLGAGGIDPIGLVTIGALAATCLAGGRVIGSEHRMLRTGLDALGLATIAYLTATSTHGVALALAWAAEAVALAELHRTTREPLAIRAAAAFGAAALIHTLAFEASPDAILLGPSSAGNAALALGAIAVGLARVAHNRPSGDDFRPLLFAGSAITALYLGSILLVGAFQPASGVAGTTLLDLSVRQEGQALLSATWSIVGLATLIIGLRRRIARLRLSGLILLLVTAGKVFLYDLSTLTSIYRVASFIALGLLLLAGAAAYQRLRPVDPQ